MTQGLNAALSDVCRYWMLPMTVSGVSQGARLSDATHLRDDIWSATPEAVAQVSLFPLSGFSGQLDLALNVTCTESSNGAHSTVSTFSGWQLNGPVDAPVNPTISPSRSGDLIVNMTPKPLNKMGNL